MPLNWMENIEELPIDTLLLLEECQLNWLNPDVDPYPFAMVFKKYPHIAWFTRHKAPEKAAWVDNVLAAHADTPLPDADTMRALEGRVLRSLEDWIIYVTDPQIYQMQPFVGWDERELLSLTGWAGKRVLDIGSGTGKQAFAIAPHCRCVYCVEPVYSLRKYLKARAKAAGVRNVYVVDGLLTDLPFEDAFFDVVTSGHVYGDDVPSEIAETMRVLRPGGLQIIIPGSGREALLENGFSSASFEEPGDGMKYKYWKVKA